LYNTNITDADAAAVADSLVSTSSIKTLGLGSNTIGDNGAASLAQAFAATAVTTSVDLSNNAIGELGVARLATALENSALFISIDLVGNLVDGDWAAAFRCYAQSSDALSGQPCVETRDVATKPLPGVAVAVVVAVSIAALVAVAIVYIVLRGRRGSGPDSFLLSEFVAVAKARAEARFVVEYRQLVTATTMTEFQHNLQQLEVPRAMVKCGAELGRG
jgi:hypothetical protein